MRLNRTWRARAALSTVAVSVGAAVCAAVIPPAHASTNSRRYDVEIAQNCVLAPVGSGRFAPADEVTITVTDWEDPLDYINFDINVAYRIEDHPLSPPAPNTSAGAVHMSHGAFEQTLTFRIYFPPAGKYLRIEDWSPGSSEYHIRQLPSCRLPG
jgi:hypothetical protein